MTIPSLFGYILMVGGLSALLATRNLFSNSPLVIVVQAAAVGLMLWARVTFGRRSFHLAANPTAGGLVTTGPYRYVRHPIYSAVCFFTGAGVAAHLNWQALLSYGVIIAGSLLRIFCEERLVEAEYPEYADYKRHTWRLVPGVF